MFRYDGDGYGMQFFSTTKEREASAEEEQDNERNLQIPVALQDSYFTQDGRIREYQQEVR